MRHTRKASHRRHKTRKGRRTHKTRKHHMRRKRTVRRHRGGQPSTNILATKNKFNERNRIIKQMEKNAMNKAINEALRIENSNPAINISKSKLRANAPEFVPSMNVQENINANVIENMSSKGFFNIKNRSRKNSRY